MINKNIFFLAIFCFIACANLNAQQKKPYLDRTKSTEERIDLLMKQMTIEEKVGQMNQYNGFWEVTGPAPKGGNEALTQLAEIIYFQSPKVVKYS